MAFLPTWNRVPVKIKLLRSGSQAPRYMTAGSIGADVYADVRQLYAAALSPMGTIYEDVPTNAQFRIYPHETRVVPLGFAIEVPTGFYAALKGRSGHAVAGTESHYAWVDCDYRQEVGMIVHGNKEGVVITHGERIGQLAILPGFRPVEDTFEIVKELSPSARSGGFGHSGKF